MSGKTECDTSIKRNVNYYSASIKNKILVKAIIWMNLENIFSWKKPDRKCPYYNSKSVYEMLCILFSI